MTERCPTLAKFSEIDVLTAHAGRSDRSNDSKGRWDILKINVISGLGSCFRACSCGLAVSCNVSPHLVSEESVTASLRDMVKLIT